MQTLTEKVLRLGPPGGVFDSAVVINLFPAATQGSRELLVNKGTPVTPAWLIAALRKRIGEIDWPAARQDVARFVMAREQASLDLWSEELFQQHLATLAPLRPFAFQYTRWSSVISNRLSVTLLTDDCSLITDD